MSSVSSQFSGAQAARSTRVARLSGLPDVQRVLTDSFDARPLTDGNLSDWKHGGFLEWQGLQEAGEWARTVTSESNHIAAESGLVPFSDRLAAVVALSLGKVIREVASGSLADGDAHEKFIVLLKQLTRLPAATPESAA